MEAVGPPLGTLTITPFFLWVSVGKLSVGPLGLRRSLGLAESRGGLAQAPCPHPSEVFSLESQQLWLEASSQEERAERLFQEL